MCLFCVVTRSLVVCFRCFVGFIGLFADCLVWVFIVLYCFIMQGCDVYVFVFIICFICLKIGVYCIVRLYVLILEVLLMIVFVVVICCWLVIGYLIIACGVDYFMCFNMLRDCLRLLVVLCCLCFNWICFVFGYSLVCWRCCLFDLFVLFVLLFCVVFC